MAKQRMADTWRSKPKQSEWFKKYPTQILKQAKLVWKWSTESGYGRAWLYYIFGVCQCLPTNYRTNYHESEEKKRCYLCISGAQETMEHMLQCPALIDDARYLKQRIKSRFDFWKIPYSNFPFRGREKGLRMKWKKSHVKDSLPKYYHVRSLTSLPVVSGNPIKQNNLSQPENLSKNWKK